MVDRGEHRTLSLAKTPVGPRAYIVMAYIIMAYIVMAYIVMVSILMAFIVMAFYGRIVMAYIVMAYIVMACAHCMSRCMTAPMPVRMSVHVSIDTASTYSAEFVPRLSAYKLYSYGLLSYGYVRGRVVFFLSVPFGQSELMCTHKRIDNCTGKCICMLTDMRTHVLHVSFHTGTRSSTTTDLLVFFADIHKLMHAFEHMHACTHRHTQISND